MEQTQTGMNSAIRREVFDSVWQDVAEASLLDDLKAALHGKLSPANQQMMLREFDIPNAPLRQKILLEHILETIHKIAQWSNADALRSTYLGYGHKILFLQSFESSASYALLTLRPDGQYQAEFNLDPDLDAREQLSVRNSCKEAFERWIYPLPLPPLSSGSVPCSLPGCSILPTQEQAFWQLAGMIVS